MNDHYEDDHDNNSVLSSGDGFDSASSSSGASSESLDEWSGDSEYSQDADNDSEQDLAEYENEFNIVSDSEDESHNGALRFRDDSAWADWHDNDVDARAERQRRESRKRAVAIVVLTLLLGVLIVYLGYQVDELYRASPPELQIETADTTSCTPNAKTTASDVHKNKRSPDNNEHVSDDYQMPTYPTRIYTHSTLSSKNYRAGGIVSDEMLQRFEEDGVLVIRNLISPKLLDRLEDASRILIEEEKIRDEEGGRKNRKKGKQFHMVKNGAIFLGVHSGEDDTTCSGRDENEETSCNGNSETTNETTDKTTILSSFRDLAMYSKIPRVAASLLRLDELRVGGAENMKPGSRRSRERSRSIKEGKQNNNGRATSTAVDDDITIDESINLRICRDIFLTKDNDPYACGWHVDDTGFWPSIASDPGVNAWVALDDMPWPWSSSADMHDVKRSTTNTKVQTPVATFALSLGSHLAPWRHQAYHVTGSTHTLPPEGYQSAADLINRRTGGGTCNIQTSAPDLYEKLEERKVVYDIRRGDVIFHDRWVFHRTVTAKEYGEMLSGGTSEAETMQTSTSDGTKNGIFRRYSIRYSPGTARVPPGYGVELSVLHDSENANRTLDEIGERDGPWYPKVWPHVLKTKPLNDDSEHVNENGVTVREEIKGLTELVYHKLPKAEELQKERKKDIQRLLSARGGR